MVICLVDGRTKSLKVMADTDDESGDKLGAIMEELPCSIHL